MNLLSFNFSEYVRHYVRNLFVAPDTRYRSHKQHTIWTFAQLFGYPIYQFINWSFFTLDDIFRRKFMKTKVSQPVFIIGSFRSGSTFLQRLMGMDNRTFTTATTWEMMFAPSVLQRQAVRGFFIFDSWFGKPVRRFIEWLDSQVFDSDSAHKMGIVHHEEDEAFFIHLYATCFLVFANPYLEDTKRYYWFDSLTTGRRNRREMGFYRSMVQRHLYSHPESAGYLSKSPTFSSRVQSLISTFPDARFIYLARHPLEVIPSLMTWFSQVWSNIEKADTRFPFRDFLIDFVEHWYVDALEELKKIPGKQVQIIPYTELVADPYKTVKDIYDWLGLELNPGFDEKLKHSKRRARSSWKPKVHNLQTDNLDPHEIARRFASVFKRFGFTLEGYVDN